MNLEKMKAVFADEAFMKQLFELETAAQVQAALKERGVELTEEEILGIRDFIIKVERGEISAEQLEKWAAQGENGELSEEALEQVAGGSIIGAIIAIIGTKAAITGLVTMVGAAIGAGVAAAVDRHGW
ncbi:MAG: hypothetical protein UEP57_07505 [Oscillospiraceae bacterium]|nr:hypothetical protein [Oscillospiraceae bacterium]